MFGYIKPFVPELKVRENELYKAVYCGLCKSMGRGTRWFSRLSLSYDAVFLAFVLASLHGYAFEVYPGRCGLNPLRKKPVAKDCEILRYSAAVSAHLTYYSVLDKIGDERGIRRLAAKISLPLCRKMKRAAEKIAELDGEYTEECLSRLHEIEAEKSPGLDRAASCFGDMLGRYFELGAPDDKKKSAAMIGDYTGRFIYAADACDDLEKDEKKDAYNPLRYGDADVPQRLHAAYGAMCIWADRAASELQLEGQIGDASSVADNIMRLGMVDTAKKVTSEHTEGKGNGK